MEENNRVLLVGTVTEEPVLDHEILGEKFYKTFVASDRKSGTADVIPVLISEKLIQPIPYLGSTVQVMGEYRSRNTANRKLCLNVFANSFELVKSDAEHINEIYLEGFICKKPNLRITPLGRHICEILLAVNRRYNRSDYIPCIAWGRDAQFVSKSPIGTKIVAEGRIQSREYKKVVGETEEIKVAYEISIGWLQDITNGKGDSE